MPNLGSSLTQATCSTSKSAPESSCSSASTVVSPSSNESTTTQLGEYRFVEVAAFLGSCKPDMSYLLNSFITYGCRNYEILKMVAEWPNDEILYLLRKLTEGEPKLLAKLTQMDLHLLARHFKTHFSA
jgi:hypothetical protein